MRAREHKIVEDSEEKEEKERPLIIKRRK